MISAKFGAFFVAVGILACPGGVRAATATLFAVADTGLSEDTPSLNFGADPAFKIGTLGVFAALRTCQEALVSDHATNILCKSKL